MSFFASLSLSDLTAPHLHTHTTAKTSTQS